MFADPGLACHKMNLQLFDALIADMPLCLSSLRLLVPPLQLMCASMWQVVKHQDVMNYWKVAEFVSLVTEMVPELLFCKNRDQLIIGMKARHILELCRIEYSVDPKIVTSHLDRIRLLSPTSEHVSEANFLKLVHSLLKDPEENEHFFKEVFPAEYGSQYDKDLQTLFWEFLCRLAQLLPPPNLQQTASWLGNAPVVEDCVHIVSESQHLRSLLQHFKNVGHLDKHVPPSPMGDCIVSALSFIPTEKDMITINQASCECRLERSQNVLFDISPLLVDNVEEEKISVTDYAEVELGTTSDSEVIIEGNHNEETTIEAVKGEVVVEVNGDEVVYETVGKTLEEHKCDGEDLIFLGEPNVHSNRRLKKTFGRHECPDCKKSFKFASALIAHRVIHTGERPFGCNECGRCFSFRQSLDRHKQRHKEKCKYDCGICEDTFPSLFACTEHKNNHMEDGVYVCPECHRRFTFDSALARHMKRHTGGKTVERLQTEPKKLQMEQENVGILDNLQDVDFAIADTHQDLALNGEKYDVIPKVECDQPAVKELLATTVVDNGMSFVKARTSGRKRKPTMKIQIINLQKRIAKVSSANKRVPDVKSVPFNSTEHSYGSPKASSREEGKNETHLQLPMGRAHCDKALEQTSTSQPHTEQNGRYTCLDCEKSFKFLSLLRAHQHVHTGRRPYLCSQCGRHFSFKQSLKRHKHTHKDGCKYVCHICGAFFKSIAAQREHNSSHMQHGLYRCPECDRTFAWKSTLVRHLKTHTVEADKSGEGSHCELNLIDGTSLSNSLSTHQAEKLHSCSCGKSFAYKSGLKAHQRTHIKERPHQCQECGKGFLYKGGLLSHMKIHSEDMPYSCSFCGKSFKRERNMKKHERCHTGENVFSCSQCDKSFVYKATLIRHELTHSGERPFLCSECGKGFFSHAELLKHERFHTGHKPFQCPHCGKRFTQSCYLTIHLRYHTGARPYSCSHCNKSFLSANRLKRHQRTHTGEKPYLCGECGKGFKESYNLKMHQRTHTPKFR